MPFFRRKPVIYEAKQFKGGGTRGNSIEIEDWVRSQHGTCRMYGDFGEIVTPEGVYEIRKGDWVVRGFNGLFYACKQDVFAAAYTPAHDEKVLDQGKLVAALQKARKNLEHWHMDVSYITEALGDDYVVNCESCSDPRQLSLTQAAAARAAKLS